MFRPEHPMLVRHCQVHQSAVHVHDCCKRVASPGVSAGCQLWVFKYVNVASLRLRESSSHVLYAQQTPEVTPTAGAATLSAPRDKVEQARTGAGRRV